MQVTDAEGIVAGKTDGELMEMLRCPQDWQTPMLDAARLQLQKRNLPIPDAPPATASETTSIWSFQGRISRSNFWALWVSLVVISIAVAVMVEFLSRYGSGAVGFLIDAAFLVIVVWIGLAMQVKRWHDLNRSGWMVLLNLTVIALPAIFIFLGFIRGTSGPNQFGTDPLGR